ncbi:MAG: hypothetical protein KDD61_12005, partial [Bdellovibrionales bacterium]|nr:hypothetical protein [Bdellovibrionales bacterium]
LQNPNPMNHTARRYLSRHCRSASQEERCKALRKKPQQPIGVELNIPAIELKDPLGHRNNYTTDEDIIWGA